jgi:hypothetical protein
MPSRVGRGIALHVHDRGTRRDWVVSSTPRPHFTPGKDPVPFVQEAGWAPGPVWTAENIAPPGFDPRTVQPVVSRYTDSDWATWPITEGVKELFGKKLSSAICFPISRYWKSRPFLGALAEQLRIATTGFVMSVHPSIQPLAMKNSAPAERIFVQFFLGNFY